MTTFRYRAVQTKQTTSDRLLTLFAASAQEVDRWVGIPQKKEFGTDARSTASVGFQREVDDERLDSLKAFYGDEKNIIQNPLLCAARQLQHGEVRFEPDVDQPADLDPATLSGIVSITVPDLDSLTLLELLSRVKADLERRVPAQAGKQVADERLADFKRQLAVAGVPRPGADEGADEDAEEEPAAQVAEEPTTDEDIADTTTLASVVFSEESHILDFWEEIAIRVHLLQDMGTPFAGDEYLGYSKDALIAFLRPAALVDGQHRLRGAIDSAKSLLTVEPHRTKLEGLIAANMPPEEAAAQVLADVARRLPVSLLMNAHPAEHVFQFVVVNQKATPVGPALLGTIVSTSLSNDEMATVSTRLINAGINLEQARAVTHLSRNPESPFAGLVERGLASDTADQLQWSVLAGLIKPFQDLKGGRLYHQRNDYADKWKRDLLGVSAIVRDWETFGSLSAYDYWRRPDGPWRDVFIAFWKHVRELLAATDDPEAKNYWGSARESNLFNKVSLTILTADFFQFLCERRQTIESVTAVPGLVDEWLRGVNRQYFAKDWNLEGVKKDSPGIRMQWAKLWEEYRKDPQRLPAKSLYRQPY
jgi:hypothetical protein